MSDNSSRIGDLAEHYAITWLWDQGYEVFKNCGCTGPIDLIAVDSDGNHIFIDVKQGIYDKRYDMYTSCTGRTPLQNNLGVVILLFDPQTRKFRFMEHKNETTYSRCRDKQQPQLDLDCSDSGC